MTEERIVWDAEFNESVTTYWLVNGMLVCIACVVGIPFLPIWYFFGKWITGKYLASHVCTLTDRSLKVSKGIFTKVEKTVPLDRLTDIGLVQGPLMRYFEIEALSVETAGQSAAGSLVHLAGIKNGREFRDAILKQRDLVVGSSEATSMPMTPLGDQGVVTGTTELLGEIRDSLVRIEKHLENKG